MDLNQVSIIGRAVKDVELRTTHNGKNIATISVASNAQGERTNFFDVIVFDKLAEIASKYVKKGKQIAVSGNLQQRSWEDKSGNKRYTVEIIGRTMQLLGKNESQSNDVVLEDIDDKPIDLSQIPF
jgi:single-strand DNA-binding protein